MWGFYNSFALYLYSLGEKQKLFVLDEGGLRLLIGLLSPSNQTESEGRH